MELDVHGPWAPLPRHDLVTLMGDSPDPWWLGGGLALEVHLQRSWRSHDDTDIGIRRQDAPTVLGRLRSLGWQAAVASGGRLRPWDGGPLSADMAHNNVWCRRGLGPWELDVTVGDGDDREWIYRRDPTLRRPWPEAVLRSAGGVPYLSPDLQLLFKSKDPRPKDDLDATVVIPELFPGGVALLHVQLAPDHPWRPLVDRHRRPCSEVDVLDVVGHLEDDGIPAWVDGGWAVDALLGRVTRPHADLDLALRREDFARSQEVLAEAQFRLVRDDGRHSVVLGDPLGRLVDVHAFDHTVTVTGADGIDRHGGDGLAYETGGFGGTGTVAGPPVRCISPATLVRYHTGYAGDDDDWHDVRLLCEHFDLPIPGEYARFTDDAPA